MRRLLAASTLALLGLAPSVGRAEPIDFTMVTQPRAIGEGDVDALYGVDGAVLLTSVKKPSPGGTSGSGGGNGIKAYQVIDHKLAVFAGATPWLMFGVEQSVSTPTAPGESVALGVLVPEVRFKVLRFDTSPVAVSLFTAPRVRLNARRSSSATLGTGIELGRRTVRFATNVALETSLASQQRENGFRYDAGLAFPIYAIVSGAVEAWGQMTWPEVGVMQMAHHLGPTVKVRVSRTWLALNANVGLKDQPNKVFYDWGGIVQIGMAW